MSDILNSSVPWQKTSPSASPQSNSSPTGTYVTPRRRTSSISPASKAESWRRPSGTSPPSLPAVSEAGTGVRASKLSPESKKSYVPGHSGPRELVGAPEIHEMLRTISIIVRDSSKSRELQQALGRASRTQLDDVIQRISDEIVDLAEDRHANFVIQKLFEVGSPVQRQRLLELISGNVSRLSRNSFGTRVLQTIVMSGEVQHQSWIIEEIEHDFLGACSDEHANWLVLKLFQLCPDYLIVRFMDLVVPIAMEMIDNRFGCRVVLVILERFLPMGYPRGNPNAPEQKALVKTSAIAERVLQHITDLACHPNGNYVLQIIAEYGSKNFKNRIIDTLTGKLVELSKDKYGSNLIERLLKVSEPQKRDLITSELISTDPSTGETNLKQLCFSPFGNFVVQTLLLSSSPEVKDSIVQMMTPYLTEITKTQGGSWIIAAMNGKRLTEKDKEKSSLTAKWSLK